MEQQLTWYRQGAYVFTPLSGHNNGYRIMQRVVIGQKEREASHDATAASTDAA